MSELTLSRNSRKSTIPSIVISDYSNRKDSGVTLVNEYESKKKVSIKALTNALKGIFSKTKSNLKIREKRQEPFDFPNAFMMGLTVGDKVQTR